MALLDDMGNKEVKIDPLIEILQKRKEMGHTVVRLTYETVGYDQAVVVDTFKE